jgi:hypothetical protein
MSIRDWPSTELFNPRGAWTSPAQVLKGRPERAFVCLNMRISPGKVGPRDGFSIRSLANGHSIGGKVTAAYNWQNSSSSNNNLVLILEGGSKIRYINVSLGEITDIATGLSARGMSFAECGPRAYLATFATTGLGASQSYVTNGLGENDKCFEPPLQVTAWTAADAGVGQCTKGTHKFGFVFLSRSGFSGLPSPVTAGGVFAPVSFTCAARRKIRLSLTLNTPAAAGAGSGVFPIMTRSDNPNRWFFVPGTSPGDFAVLPPSAAGWGPIAYDIDISDEDLANRGLSADEQFNILSQAVNGTGPFNPSVVIPYNRRMVYIVGNTVYVSDVDAPQNLNAALNTLNIPGGYQVVTGFALNNALYLLGSSWTGVTEDAGGVPQSWPQPRSVSQRIGTSAPNGVCSRTAGGYAWVATESGLYVFDGHYPDKPISYFQSDWWKRINWNAAYAIQVVDDFVNLRCYVAAPLDGATEPTHLLSWDYTNGRSFDTCDFTADTFDPAVLFSAIALVKEAATDRSIIWLFPQAAGNILKQDPTVKTDNGYAIDYQYETGWQRTGGGGPIIRVGGMQTYAKGSGNLSRTIYSRDHKRSLVPTGKDGVIPMTLSVDPGVDLFDKFDFAHVEDFSVLLAVKSPGSWFELEMLRSFWKPDLMNR